MIIFPYAKALPNGQENPKNYPYWPELIKLLQGAGHIITQIGVVGEKQLVEDFRTNLPLSEISRLIQWNDWISVDSFAPHLAWTLGKPGVVIFSQSDPNIFGHVENTNLLKDRKYLRPNQFWLWSQCQYDINAYMSPEEVFSKIR